MAKYCKTIRSKAKEEIKSYYEDRRGWFFNILSPIIFAIITPFLGCLMGEIICGNIGKMILSGVIVGVIVFVLWYVGSRIYYLLVSPAKIYYEQNKIIKDLEKDFQLIKEPDKLKIRQRFFRVERDHFYTWIENYSNKKIIDIEARIQMVHMIKSKHEGHESVFMQRQISPKRKNILDQKEIRAGNSLEVCIATAVFDENKIVF